MPCKLYILYCKGWTFIVFSENCSYCTHSTLKCISELKILILSQWLYNNLIFQKSHSIDDYGLKYHDNYPSLLITNFTHSFIPVMAHLWMCSNHVQRKKSDLCDIDIVMSSLRDTGEEML